MANHLLAIGINYTGTANALRGCVNDANAWTDQFRPHLASAPILLTEQLATKANILDQIAKLLAQLKAGDWGIITYSGHGTYIPDTSGDEEDRRDEALCPWDMQRNLLLDDELRDAFSKRAQGSRLLFISDCCHSGTITRDVDQDRGEPRYVDFASLTACMCSATVDRIMAQARAGRRAVVDQTGLVHLAGCQDDQVSYDATIAGRACGAFTYYALAALKARKTPGLTFAEWKEAVRPYLPSNRYPQSPGFNGELAGVVPGFEVTPSNPTLPASAEGTLTLGGKVYDVRERIG